MVKLILSVYAGVTELADVADSKSADSNIVWVQVPPPAPMLKARWNLRNQIIALFVLPLFQWDIHSILTTGGIIDSVFPWGVPYRGKGVRGLLKPDYE